MLSVAGYDRKTDKLGADDNVLPANLCYTVAASVTCTAGGLVEVNSAGYAQPGGTAATSTMMGVCLRTIANGTTAGAVNVEVQPGPFYFDNASGGGDAIAITDIGKACYAVDDHTVSKSSSTSTRPYAGVILGVRADGQIAVQVGLATPSTTSGTTLPRYTARGMAVTNHSLSAFTVGTNTDSITYVAGDIVVLCGQSIAAQNGPYVVGAVSTTAPLTRPSWFAAAAAITQGMTIELSGEGTVYGGATLKAMCAKAQTVDANDPKFFPSRIKGSAAATSGTLTVTGLPVWTTAVAMAEDFTTPANNAVLAATLTAGAPATGQIAITGGTTTDVFKYVITNW
jgi:hypothetical protein